MAKSSRSFFSLSRAEARGHAIILAAVLWIGAGVLMFSTPGYTDPLGSLKGTDFVHFYTMGRAALVGEPQLLYDQRALHEFQTVLVPEAASSLFTPVNPPQTALLFAPLSALPYGWALAVWSLVAALGYAAVVAVACRRWPGAFGDRVLVVAAALGFPPFWNLILHGQTTVVPLLAFLLAWLALERERPLLAGIALGLLAIKPQYGLVLAVVVLVGAEWAMLAGAVLCVAFQLLVVALTLGPEVIADYLVAIAAAPAAADQIEPRPYQMHSIRALTKLLPLPFSVVAWGVLSAVVAWQAVRSWTSSAPAAVRFSLVVLASVLVSPHVFVYDATLLVMPLLLLGGWMESRRDAVRTDRYWLSIYALVLAFLVPFALLLKVQVSVFIQAWIFKRATRDGASSIALDEDSPRAT